MSEPVIDAGVVKTKDGQVALKDIQGVEIRRNQLLLRLAGSAIPLLGAFYFSQVNNGWPLATVFGIFGAMMTWFALTATWSVVASTGAAEVQVAKNKYFREATAIKDRLMIAITRHR